MILKSLILRTFVAWCLLQLAVVSRSETTNDVPQGSVSATSFASSIHKLGPSDKLQVVVYQEDDLNATVTLDDKGMVMLPLLEKVKLGGMTVEGATEYIQAAYGKDYLVNPQVNVTVLQYAPRHFSVLGEVQRPGSFDIPDNENVNILEAIALAGGYTRLGSPAKVSVRRVVDGKTVLINLNADAIAKKQAGQLFEILPDDIISVGEKIL
jgi:polysaccharide export outer membrane protein